MADLVEWPSQIGSVIRFDYDGATFTRFAPSSEEFCWIAEDTMIFTDGEMREIWEEWSPFPIRGARIYPGLLEA